MAHAATKRRVRVRKDQRLETRLNSVQKSLIERAAELRGTTITDFVVQSAHEAALNTIREFEVLILRGNARKIFVKHILNPPAPNEALRKAAAHYKTLRGM